MTGLANTQVDSNKRGEIKLTATPIGQHTLQGRYLNNSTEQQDRPNFGSSIDPFTVGSRTIPNSFYYTNYRGEAVARHLLPRHAVVAAGPARRRHGIRVAFGFRCKAFDNPRG